MQIIVLIFNYYTSIEIQPLQKKIYIYIFESFKIYILNISLSIIIKLIELMISLSK